AVLYKLVGRAHRSLRSENRFSNMVEPILRRVNRLSVEAMAGLRRRRVDRPRQSEGSFGRIAVQAYIGDAKAPASASSRRSHIVRLDPAESAQVAKSGEAGRSRGRTTEARITRLTGSNGGRTERELL